MSTNTAVMSLESLARCLRAARDFPHEHVDSYTEGINSGLNLALRAIDSELNFVRLIEKAAAERTAQNQ